MTIDADTIATTAEIIGILGFTKQYLHKLERQGVVTRAGRDQWPLAATVKSVLAHMRSEQRHSKHAEAAAELARAKVRVVELRVERENRELIRLAEAESVLDRIVGVLLAGMSGIGPRVTRDLALRQQIEMEVRAVRQAVADELRRQGEALRTGGKAAA